MAGVGREIEVADLDGARVAGARLVRCHSDDEGAGRRAIHAYGKVSPRAGGMIGAADDHRDVSGGGVPREGECQSSRENARRGRGGLSVRVRAGGVFAEVVPKVAVRVHDQAGERGVVSVRTEVCHLPVLPRGRRDTGEDHVVARAAEVADPPPLAVFVELSTLGKIWEAAAHRGAAGVVDDRESAAGSERGRGDEVECAGEGDGAHGALDFHLVILCAYGDPVDFDLQRARRGERVAAGHGHDAR